MKRPDPVILGALLMLLIVWWWVASAVWQWRNPTANSSTLISEFPSVVTFQKLQKYQGR